MSQSIGFQQALAASQVVGQNTDVNNSEFNPLQQSSRVSFFGAATTAGTGGRGCMVTVKLGSRILCSDLVVPVASAVSTRDHLVATGMALRGEKITISIRNEGTATPTLNGVFVIE